MLGFMITKYKKYNYNNNLTVSVDSIKWTAWLLGKIFYQEEIGFITRDIELIRI